ncbi:unnamed protein product [Coregonus sp. 'balchen']|nr:unnamed protein product [Coregonus sp. 'balchen']
MFPMYPWHADQASEDRQAMRDHEVRERTALIDSLTQEVEASQAASGVQRDRWLLRDKMAGLRRECPEALEESEKRLLQELEGELGEKLAQQQISEQQLDALKEKLAQQELTLEQLRAEMEEAKAMAHIDSENSVAEVVTLRGKSWLIWRRSSAPARRREREAAVTVSQSYNNELMSQMERAAELEETLFEKEAQVSGLQRSLREAQEVREDEETAAVQEARRREVERRKELLAVAREAIAQKDAKLEKRPSPDKVKGYSQDLERKGDDNCDLKEKLADSKNNNRYSKFKRRSSPCEKRRNLKLKLQDLDKVKKRHQADLDNKDRTIRQ